MGAGGKIHLCGVALSLSGSFCAQDNSKLFWHIAVNTGCLGGGQENTSHPVGCFFGLCVGTSVKCQESWGVRECLGKGEKPCFWPWQEHVPHDLLMKSIENHGDNPNLRVLPPAAFFWPRGSFVCNRLDAVLISVPVERFAATHWQEKCLLQRGQVRC